MTFRYLDVCAGISAATVAFSPLGWKALAYSEIEAFPRAVLQHRYPDTPLHGDFTRLRDETWIGDADLLMGGTPCQDFSLAGLRQSLSGERGNLTLEFIRLANAIDAVRAVRGLPPAWILWENVDGVLSVKDNAFGAFLGGLVGADAPLAPEVGKWTRAGVVAGPERVAAWRVLDAQHFGLAQRRKRVFVLARGGAGAFMCADALLPVINSLHGHPPPRREPGQGVARSLGASTGGASAKEQQHSFVGADGSLLNPLDVAPVAFGGNNTQGPIEITPALLAHHGAGYKIDFESETLIQAPKAFPDFAFKASHYTRGKDGKPSEIAPALSADADKGDQDTLICFSGKDWAQDANTEIAPTLRAMPPGKDGRANGGGQLAVAFALRGREGGALPEVHGDGDQVGTLRAAGGGSSRDYVAEEGVRRLMPVECERLQGFADGYTRIPVRTYKTKPKNKHIEKYADLYEEQPDGSWVRFVEDGPRFRALGNSIATTVLADIGRRIEAQRLLEAV